METISEYPKEAGIYKFTCNNNGKVYIGKAVNLFKRINQHKTPCVEGYFQNAILKHGWDSFTVEILEIFENFDKLNDNLSLLEREAYYIELFDSTDRTKGYNRCKFSSDTTGIVVSEETREKMRQKKLGVPRKPYSEETKRKLRHNNLGRVFSDETKEKMRLARLGKRCSEETKEKMRLARLGKRCNPLTEETKEKIRQANLGKKHSEETKKKVSQANLGKKLSEEHKEKLRKIKLGTKHSEESKEKMRIAKLGKSKNTNNNESNI